MLLRLCVCVWHLQPSAYAQLNYGDLVTYATGLNLVRAIIFIFILLFDFGGVEC